MLLNFFYNLLEEKQKKLEEAKRLEAEGKSWKLSKTLLKFQIMILNLAQKAKEEADREAERLEAEGTVATVVQNI